MLDLVKKIFLRLNYDFVIFLQWMGSTPSRRPCNRAVGPGPQASCLGNPRPSFATVSTFKTCRVRPSRQSMDSYSSSDGKFTVTVTVTKPEARQCQFSGRPGLPVERASVMVLDRA